MKKIILLILLSITVLTALPSNSYSSDKRHPRRVVVINKWPRRHVIIVYHRRHRHHRFRRIPVWIPRDPWR
ncbi:MAG: hypothetical protein ACHQJ4_05970 [Ignavibacteria bacterium]